ETLLARSAEEVEHQLRLEADPAEVHGHGGGGLGAQAVGVVNSDTAVAQRLLGPQRPYLADRPDQGGLTDAEAARDQDLGGRRDAGLVGGAVKVIQVHQAPFSVAAGRVLADAARR